MLTEMARIAAACIRNPGRHSVWSPQLGRYVCPDTPGGRDALAAATSRPVTPAMQTQAAKHPPINAQFKLVFLTAAGGTLVFALVCVILTLLAGKQPPPLVEKLVMGFFDLAKIGF